ncbi:Transcriptional regulators of sugar metabolism [Caballeronia glathei]|jgi:DeoR/GlpR family transcriptional regulator of sugar metabolism|uniref:AraC family transcriptional regulator n=1 Tax=Caballeronia glathei TaxID=60547 RepID=A0A069PFN7_9BURK|nr:MULTISPECIES: DeoR/GlpR family DNA-binding transcription regulator [Burkholderiaceae]KDR39503.1 AraC family transcriptional regulator [Caballeronia glathei]TCK38152.1 DeoR family transcriptional regulator [Paraburkholderia sp. BL8N3]CDY78270.1 Transcriptional regulators of sugar metabolism [Caballeronia glathei]
MLAEQRHQYILSEVSKNGALSVAELVRALGVSRETVRRDLNTLAGRGLILTTHGGALAADRREPHVDVRVAANAAAKRAIGERAARLVPDGASLIIDSGSTTHALARALADRHRLTVYTNDWRTAMLLGRRNDNRVTLLGGELADLEDATFGLDTVQQLSQYHADFAFVGAGGITSDAFLTDYSRVAAEVRSRMIGAAGTAVVVADHSKFGLVTPVRIRDFEKVRYLITERAPDKALRRALAARGPELMIA